MERQQKGQPSPESDSFADFCAAAWEPLIRLARTFGPSLEPEDLVQTTFTRVLSSYDTITGGSGGRLAFSRTVLRNTALDELRRRRVRPTVSIDESLHGVAEPRWFGELRVDPASTEREALAHLDVEAVRKSLLSLAELDREYVARKYWRDESAAEVASALGLTDGQLRHLHRRVIARLRRTFENGGCDRGPGL